MVTPAALGLLLLAATPTGAAPTTVTETSVAESQPAGVEAVDVTAEVPPPSTFDRIQAERDAGVEAPSPAPDEDFSIWAQLAQTTVALFIVVGIIYLFGRIILPRLAGMRLGSGSGRIIEVVERTQLDNRHSLVVVRIDGGQSMLLSTGEGGVRLVAELSNDALASAGTSKPASHGFKKALERAAAAQSPAAPGTERNDDA